jgi:hypothetical protein
MALFLQLLEYSWRSTWDLDACGGARLKLRRGQRRRSQHIAGRTERFRVSNSVVNLVLEDLDEPLNPENEGGSSSGFREVHSQDLGVDPMKLWRRRA